MFIGDDPATDADLPDTYGVDDIPLIIQDKRFDGGGTLDDSAPFMSATGTLGDTILVNGTHNTYIEATTTLVRLRLLNASNARVYNLGFTDDRHFWQVASDSGLLEHPHKTRRLQLAPGERAAIIVAVEPGDETILRSFGPDLGMGWNARFNGGDDTFDIVQLRAAEQLDESAPLPDRLATIDRPDPADAATTRHFSLQGHRINGREMDMGRIEAVVTAVTTEIWEVTNDLGNAHTFHPHLVHFAVLDMDGAPPPPELSGWKDTIYVPPHTTIRIIAPFDGQPDPDTPSMFHCHMLAHEDDGMMGHFVVVEPGGDPGDTLGAMAGHEH
jgi:FtsP/CotA-like multicopper oxidase with cupredoxin domain